MYDVTKFLDDHPGTSELRGWSGLAQQPTSLRSCAAGGPEILLTKCGDDGTDAFEEVFHQEPARKQLKDFFIGRLHVSAPWPRLAHPRELHADQRSACAVVFAGIHGR